MRWYVNVENQAYGPYSDDQMRGFVAEGRITTASLISQTPDTGFCGAAEFDEFNLWSGAYQETLQPRMAVGAQGIQSVQSVQSAQGMHGVQGVRNVQAAQQHQTQAQYAPIQPATQPTPEPAAQSPQTRSPGAKSKVYLILAEIHSGGEMAFLQALQNFGQTERIGDTVWLVRTSHAVEQIRNHLSQTLNQQDRLFILDSKAGKTAWFNIGADLDHRIRELWDEDEG